MNKTLDLAVALSTKTLVRVEHRKDGDTYCWLDKNLYSPSTNWSQGGPLIEQHQICIDMDEHQGWLAAVKPYGVPIYVSAGSTPLEAAMQCLVKRLKG